MPRVFSLNQAKRRGVLHFLDLFNRTNPTPFLTSKNTARGIIEKDT